MTNIEMQSTSTTARVGSGSSSSEEDYQSISAVPIEQTNRTDQASQHSLGSIASRLNSIFRLFVRSKTMSDLALSTLVCLGHMVWWWCFRTSAFCYLMTDLPTKFIPCKRDACVFPRPCGGNEKCRPHIALLKLGLLAVLLYSLFLIINLTNLAVTGKFALTLPCILSLTSCRTNFLICQEVRNISEDDFLFINYLLSKSFVRIENGNLLTLPIQPKVMNMSGGITPFALPFSNPINNSINNKTSEVLQPALKSK